jgi:hypothetical protein
MGLDNHSEKISIGFGFCPCAQSIVFGNAVVQCNLRQKNKIKKGSPKNQAFVMAEALLSEASVAVGPR